MRVLTVVGARPQFVKASMLSKALKKKGIEETLVHSGQHYDKKISQVFFDELGIPQPSINLGVGSASHSMQTGTIMVRLDAFLQSIHEISCLLVYGDTNTTLAGALVAAKKNIPLVHVEAGLRSFNPVMPEEINRVITDRLSSLLFCPTQTSIDNLRREGIQGGVFLAGDVMYDATIHFAKIARKGRENTSINPFGSGQYYLTTIHRPSNTDNLERLLKILDALNELDYPILFPAHPRTKVKIDQIRIPPRIKIIEPASYLQMLMMIQEAKAVITDSGGIQKESYWLRKPCVTLRTETEWLETLEGGWNKLVGSDVHLIHKFLREVPPSNFPQVPLGKPNESTIASDLIAKTMLDYFA